MNPVLSFIVAFSTPAFAADIEPPIHQPVQEVTILEPAPIAEPSKPLPAAPTEKPEACNCYNILRENFDSLLPMDTLQAVAQPYTPEANVAVFLYPATPEWPNGIPHVALVHDQLPDGSIQIEEYNYHSCTHSTRTINPNDHRLVGFVSL